MLQRDNIIPGPPIQLWSVFEVSDLRSTYRGLPLENKRQEILFYLYNIVEKVYGVEYSPQTNAPMRYDVDEHVEAFLALRTGITRKVVITMPIRNK